MCFVVEPIDEMFTVLEDELNEQGHLLLTCSCGWVGEAFDSHDKGVGV